MKDIITSIWVVSVVFGAASAENLLTRDQYAVDIQYTPAVPGDDPTLSFVIKTCKYILHLP